MTMIMLRVQKDNGLKLLSNVSSSAVEKFYVALDCARNDNEYYEKAKKHHKNASKETSFSFGFIGGVLFLFAKESF